MAKPKKDASKALFKEAPVTSYPYVDNRLVIIDWASLSYHLFHSIGSDKNREKYGLLDSEGELELWRTKMIDRVMEYIALFNPRHLVFALEGKAAWRRKFVEEYYGEHAEIYYNKSEYYVLSDNYLYMVQQAADGGYAVTQLSIKDRAKLSELKHRKLKDMPEKQQRMFWGIYTPGGDPILPSYKGQRKSKPWKFSTEKKVWAEYRERFAQELAPLFRARAIQCHHAEGDDIIYATIRKYAGDCDDVIVITRDSDMAQLASSKVKLFNHQTDTFIVEPDPVGYLDGKVLAGDSADNINGMAFVDTRKGKVGLYYGEKTTQIATGSAHILLESCPNVYETAKKNGWADQYMRNRTLIDLSRIPAEVSREIETSMDACPEPASPAGFERFEFWDVPDMARNNYMRLQATGFYCVNPAKGGLPFNANLFTRYRAEAEKPKIELPEDVVTADNIGLDAELSDIDVIF
jgi:5''-3'' exonuclease (including N-terminal domain of PolI)